MKDEFKSSSIALFSALLTPSTLLSGAAYGTMFALKVNPLTDTPIIILERRLFIVLSGLTTACALTAVISSAMALFRLRFMSNASISLASLPSVPSSYGLKDFLRDNVRPFFLSSFVNFTAAMAGFVSMVAVRAWHVLSCPDLALGLALFLAGFAVNILSLIERALWGMDGGGYNCDSWNDWRFPDKLLGLVKEYAHFLMGRMRFKNGAPGQAPFRVVSCGLWVGGSIALGKSFAKAIAAI
ncbi:hypothetical protein TrRE_jg11231 [Triparma retinervis]|uniref:Uncharacterized protein n=1 Tax=Triparma retinervis TaxID=2557542 RepID=A0A9W7DS68_9STRA|nr:hypothetical protein TrRE_jg11231 [Triparma retinervis]